MYDTILVYSHALNRTKDPADGLKISDEIKNLRIISGKTGKIITNSQGSRYSEMLAYILLQDSDEEMTAVLRLSPTRETGYYTASVIEDQRAPTRVPDTPPCTWQDLGCLEIRITLISGVCVVMVSILSITILRICVTRRRVPKQSFFIIYSALS